ncbi:MAG TPA: peptide chain release factor N(5)-glutamine methyltransferase [Silvibacterium sp.]|nr:peptide chain release factor N(5)-glutamine methyltransferase [Silvibacterium sp.]
MTLTTALDHGIARLAYLPTARRDAELLLLRATGGDHVLLLTHPDTALTPEQLSTYDQWLIRRARHEPIQYITGEQEFYGLTLRVTPAVLIPRPETEHLVEALLHRVPHNAPLGVADIGTGSGAIAIALAHHLPKAAITALDASAAALTIAQQNADRHNLTSRIRFLESDLLNAVAGETFDAIVSNPPYVPQFELLEPQVHDFEPHTALYAGPSGLDIYQRLIPQAWQALNSGGLLLMEIGHGQQSALAILLAQWSQIEFIPDLQGIPRVAIARHP